MKTKIVRIIGGELYLKQVTIQGEPRWESFKKDTSALCRSNHDTRFKGGSTRREARLHSDETPVRPIPDNWASELLGEYAKLAYAPGHEPLQSFRL